MEEINMKEIIFLAIFIIVGIVLFQPIVSYVTYLTNPGSYTTYVTTSGTLTETTSSFVSNPEYVGSSNATLVALVPVFYLLVLIVVPAIISYKIYKE
ncbi:V1/V3 family capsid protein [Acidianus ambivalens]|uniref:DUF1035 domain-containing protein n=1 Tax=Acidianus ambivalens TaxID=2283 RepID=A0A650CTF3_ACIAM|nr:V1/V3 family capsid protein [Acidianus ambivalens]MQL56426.1 DUF1035 domain-containing protein [Acidianus ambivalens]QGR21063.1 DUF1035 domain-containing protein [Acidianus ambivalens]